MLADFPPPIEARELHYARQTVPADASAEEVHAFIEALPEHALEQLDILGDEEKHEFDQKELAG